MLLRARRNGVLKVWDSKQYADVARQVQGYLDKLHALGMPTQPSSTDPVDPSAHMLSVLDGVGDYNDFFSIEAGACPGGTAVQTKDYHAYTEDDRPYVLAVRLESETGCPQGQPPVVPRTRK